MFGASAKNIFVNINMSQFNRGDKTMVEFYYSFPDTTLIFKYKENGKFTGEIYFNVEFYDNIKLVKSAKWIMPLEIEKYDGTHKQVFYGQNDFAMESGQYTVKVHVSDYNDSTSKAKIEFPYVIKKFQDTKIDLSDIELAAVLEKKDEALRNWDKMFEKPGYYVVPNPSAEFNDDPGNLLFYCELYNTKKFSPEGITIYYKIMNSTGEEKLRFPIKKPANSDAMVLSGEIPLNQLPTGVYYFNITAVYPNNKPIDSVTVTKKMFYYNKYKAAEQNATFVENITFEKSEFVTFSESRTDDEIEQAAIIATESERKSLRSLNTLQAKQRFLFKFWAQRDPDTTTTINETRATFLKNIEYANMHFKYGKVKDGWKTDRGKILLKYGKPEEINYNNGVESSNTYDEWVYENLFGGCRFYFVDIGGYGKYRYVHSTAPGERYNPNWYTQFVDKTNEDDTKTNTNSGMW